MFQLRPIKSKLEYKINYEQLKVKAVRHFNSYMPTHPCDDDIQTYLMTNFMREPDRDGRHAGKRRHRMQRKMPTPLISLKTLIKLFLIERQYVDVRGAAYH